MIHLIGGVRKTFSRLRRNPSTSAVRDSTRRSASTSAFASAWLPRVGAELGDFRLDGLKHDLLRIRDPLIYCLEDDSLGERPSHERLVLACALGSGEAAVNIPRSFR